MQSSSKNSYWKFGDPIDSRTAEEGREEVRQAGYTVSLARLLRALSMNFSHYEGKVFEELY